MTLLKEMKKITTNFETSNNEDVINRAHLDEKLFKINGHLSVLEKHYNEFKLQYNKQSAEEVLVQRAVKRSSKYFMTNIYLIVFPMQIGF